MTTLTMPERIGYTSPVPSGMRAWQPGTKGAASRTPLEVCGFSIAPDAARGMAPFLAGRAGHPQGCAGSFGRSANLHGLPPSLGREGGRFKTCSKGAIMANTPSRRTAPRITVIDGSPTTTSRDIAETFGREHKNVLERIRNLDCSPEFNALNFKPVEYTDAKGEQRTEYRITRDGFAFLCMGFTGAKAAQWKERYIAHFNRMEQTLRERTQRKAVKAAPVALPTPEPATIDVRGLLLSGQSEPQPLPPELLRTINDRAWEIMRELHPLLHEHMQRRVAYMAINGHGHINTDKALKAVRDTTLGNALASEHHHALLSCVSHMGIVAKLAAQAEQAARAAVGGAKGVA